MVWTVATLLSDSSNTSVILDTTSQTDGVYTLSGEICDGIDACTPFALGDTFTISNTLPIQSVSSISLVSNNGNTAYAKNGNTVALTFETTGTVVTPTVDMYFDGDEGINTGVLSNVGNVWTYTYVVAQDDSNGGVSFVIDSETLDSQYSETTNSTYVTVDTIAPEVAVVNPVAGVYPSTDIPEITLLSGENIFFTTSGSTPDCNVGTNYSGPISITEDTVIKSVVCDSAGNKSDILESEYFIREDLTSISVSSSNLSVGKAKAGDIISLEFTSSDTITSASVDMYIDGTLVADAASATNVAGDDWIFDYTVLDSDSSGEGFF